MRVTIFSGLLLLVAAVSAPVMAQPPEGNRPEGPRRFDPSAIFERFDEDGDGALSEDEAPDRMKERFAEIDADGDGKVTLEEFEAARPQRPERGDREDRPNRPARDGQGEGRPPRGDGEGRPPRGEGAGRPPRGEGEGRPPRDPAAFAERVFERHDENEDGLLTLDEVPEQFQEGFKKILEEANAEGLTLEEYQAAMEKRFAERRAQREAGEGDRPRRGPGEGRPPRDGDASPGEGRPPRDGDRPRRERPDGPPHGPNPERMMGHLLERVDTNEDGQISREEFLEHVGEHFDKVDTNSDGVVDEEELGAAMENWRPPHRPGPPPERE